MGTLRKQGPQKFILNKFNEKIVQANANRSMKWVRFTLQLTDCTENNND